MSPELSRTFSVAISIASRATCFGHSFFFSSKALRREDAGMVKSMDQELFPFASESRCRSHVFLHERLGMEHVCVGTIALVAVVASLEIVPYRVGPWRRQACKEFLEGGRYFVCMGREGVNENAG